MVNPQDTVISRDHKAAFGRTAARPHGTTAPLTDVVDVLAVSRGVGSISARTEAEITRTHE